MYELTKFRENLDFIKSYYQNIKLLCLQYQVLKLYVFGSILTKQFNSDSDIDFLVEFDQIELQDYADNFFDFKYSLESLFRREIDLLEVKAISNPYFKKNVDYSKQLIYG